MIEQVAEPSLLAYLGLGHWVNFVEVDALIGAFIGSSIFTARTTGVTWGMKILGLFISALCGYFFAIELKDFVNEFLGRFANIQFKRLDILACIIAIISVPFLTKLVDWANNFDFGKMVDDKIEQLSKKRKKQKKQNNDEDMEG